VAALAFSFRDQVKAFHCPEETFHYPNECFPCSPEDTINGIDEILVRVFLNQHYERIEAGDGHCRVKCHFTTTG
jgi:hypothetical protein